MTKFDVVYFVRPGDTNEELRYSLRSLVHLPHRKVWIVGHTPAWVQGVESIRGNVFRDKWFNVVDNLRLAALHVTAHRFVVMNDDIFLMRTPDLGPLFRGPLVDQIAKAAGPWRASLEQTYAHLASIGIDEPISYELHRPVVMERAKLLSVTRLALGWKANPPQWRTLYGNLYEVGGVQVLDGKLNRRGYLDRTEAWRDMDVLSTEDHVFRSHEAGRHIRSVFSEPSPYENPAALDAHRHRRLYRTTRPMRMMDQVAV